MIAPARRRRTTLLLSIFTASGVTKPLFWDVAATVAGEHIRGTATTHFTFGDFNMTQPRVPVVASVVDDIKIEYDFHLIREHQ